MRAGSTARRAREFQLKGSTPRPVDCCQAVDSPSMDAWQPAAVVSACLCGLDSIEKESRSVRATQSCSVSNANHSLYSYRCGQRWRSRSGWWPRRTLEAASLSWMWGPVQSRADYPWMCSSGQVGSGYGASKMLSPSLSSCLFCVPCRDWAGSSFGIGQTRPCPGRQRS